MAKLTSLMMMDKAAKTVRTYCLPYGSIGAFSVNRRSRIHSQHYKITPDFGFRSKMTV
jgi:hypothetical protein